MSFNYNIIKNNRCGGGYMDESLTCDECGGLTTRYLLVEHTLLCRTCLSRMIEEMKSSLLEEIWKPH